MFVPLLTSGHQLIGGRCEIGKDGSHRARTGVVESPFFSRSTCNTPTCAKCKLTFKRPVRLTMYWPFLFYQNRYWHIPQKFLNY